MKHFPILIGGPGVFDAQDKQHDQNWSNYFVPIQLAAMKNSYNTSSAETVHWLLFEPAYERRFAEDSRTTTAQAGDSGRTLSTIRKAAADKVGVAGYTGRIKALALQYRITYHGLRTPSDFWDVLGALAAGSISRTWYCGHSSATALFLSLGHDGNHVATGVSGEMIGMDQIDGHHALAAKFDHATRLGSKFISCNSIAFASKWSQIFGVPAEGADGKINFAVIDQPSTEPDIIKRLQGTPAQGWKNYGAAP